MNEIIGDKMKLYKQLGDWNIYLITFTTDDDDPHSQLTYDIYVAFDGKHFPVDGLTLENVQSQISEKELVGEFTP